MAVESISSLGDRPLSLVGGSLSLGFFFPLSLSLRENGLKVK